MKSSENSWTNADSHWFSCTFTAVGSFFLVPISGNPDVGENFSVIVLVNDN